MAIARRNELRRLVVRLDGPLARHTIGVCTEGLDHIFHSMLHPVFGWLIH